MTHAVADPGKFKTGGAVESYGSGVCFDAPSHITYWFLVRIVNKIHIVNIVCRLQLEYLCVTQTKILKHPKSLNQGGARQSWIRIWHASMTLEGCHPLLWN